MKQSSQLYVFVLASLALLTAISGIVSDVAAAQLPAWFEPFRPWVWPVFGFLAVITVVLVIFQARLENPGDSTPQPQPIHVHLETPPSQPLPASPLEGLSIRAKPSVCHNLPQPDYSIFIGREKELAQVHRILRPYPHSQEHLVTIDGVGGVGKSALALEVAHRYLRDYERLPKGERFEAIIWTSAKAVVLTADGIASRPQITRTLDDIYTTISIVLELEEITRARPEERDGLVTKALARQRTLLIVDNLETIDDERANTFLRELPAPTKAIVTTRHRIDVAYPVRLVGMSWEEAQELITRECEKKGVGLIEEHMHGLYDRTGGVPLALVWSVAQMGYGYSPDEVLRRLGNPQGDIARFCFHSTIERIRGKSAYRILLALAVFATDASREALGCVAGFGEDMLSRDEGLVELEKLSLANKRDGRFSLLPLTKAYAISLSPDQRALRSRQEEFYLDFCREYGGTTENWENYSRIDQERQNLIDLLEWCQQNQRWQALLDLQDSLSDYWELRSYWSEQERWCQRALEACSQLAVDSSLSVHNQRKKGASHLALCWVRLNQDRFEDAGAEAKKALEILKPIEDQHGIAVAYRHLGLVEKLQGELEQNRGHLDCAQEHFVQAKAYYEAALDIWRSSDNQRDVSSVLANIGHMLIAQGKYSEAHGFLQQALTIRRQIKDSARISTTLRGLGLIDELEGKLESAAGYYLEALEIAEQVGDKLSAGRAAFELAELKRKQGYYQKAISLATQAHEFFQALNKTAFIEQDAERAKELLQQLQALQGRLRSNNLYMVSLC
jgi:tetratricopeptide (TPR) repeat protein